MSSGERKYSEEDRRRYQTLFERMDVNRLRRRIVFNKWDKYYLNTIRRLNLVNKDGKIEVKELAGALRARKTAGDVGGQAKQASSTDKNASMEIISKADKDDNAELDFAEFAQYMEEHERKLRLAFSDLDRNKDGMIEPSEVQAALNKLGLNVDLAEAERLTRKIDKDGNIQIDWQEWRDFFHFASIDSMDDLVTHWRSSVSVTHHVIQRQMIDIGDNITCPPEFTKKEKQTGMWWRHLTAGAMAGAVSRTFTAPLDRLKIMLQVHGSSTNLGMVSGFKHMLKEGGVKSLWRGNGTNVLKIAPESAIKFAAYEQFKGILVGSSDRPPTVAERFAAGSSAGAFAQTCIYPLEVMKTRLAVAKSGEYRGLIDCGMKVYKQGGLGALYKGYLPNLLGIIPYAGIDLTIYETLKQKYLRGHPEVKEPSVMLLLACGTVSSTCGQLASYPLALVRTKLQAGATPEAQAGFVTLATSIVKKEGFRGLYRGIAPNFLKVLPAVSISYVIYERCKGALGINK